MPLDGPRKSVVKFAFPVSTDLHQMLHRKTYKACASRLSTGRPHRRGTLLRCRRQTPQHLPSRLWSSCPLDISSPSVGPAEARPSSFVNSLLASMHMVISPSAHCGVHVASVLLLLCLSTASASASVNATTSATPGASARAAASTFGTGEPLAAVSVAPRTGADLGVTQVVIIHKPYTV